ncbi:sodium:calcium antiporter [Acidovorax soli]|uniref:sodium:calcium antiporter n=1 Tax=Acidovorax TaxID=12916 RepID=UPI0026EEC728|nr:sodium:calcium antiporter [Acidovorax soli]MCM2347522.1 sodium:calcium antiporter [Acidovorax soli]
MSAPVWAWLQFIACAALIGAAGFQLSRYGDAIARHTGLSGSWIGLTLVASVTSLPELATGITSVTIAQAPNLAVGNALGSCVLNLVFLVWIDLIYRRAPVWSQASKGHVLAAAFGVVLLGFLLMGLLIGQLGPHADSPGASRASVWGVGLMTPVMLMLYLIAMRTLFAYECSHPDTSAAADTPPSLPLRHALVRFVLAASVVVGAGLWLPFAAVELANTMGWNRSFVGSLFVAMATTLPELAVTLSALRLGALDMAIGNLLGSNLFNVTIVAVDDFFYRPGVLLSDVSLVHAVTAGSAIVMTGLALVGLFFRPRDRVLRAVGAVSLGLAAVYLLNTYVVFLHGA